MKDLVRIFAEQAQGVYSDIMGDETLENLATEMGLSASPFWVELEENEKIDLIARHQTTFEAGRKIS